MYEGEEDLEVCAENVWAVDSRDEWYQSWIEEVTRDPMTHSRRKMVGGRLFHYLADEVVEAAASDDEAWKLVVPRGHRRKVLRESHEDPTVGHQGREKTHERAAR